MKKWIAFWGLSGVCVLALAAANAQSTPKTPDLSPASSAAAGAPSHEVDAEDEAYLPGPGGGEPETDGPPLQSTGLEDGPGGCKCHFVGRTRTHHLAVLLALPLGVSLLLARRATRVKGCKQLGSNAGVLPTLRLLAPQLRRSHRR